MSSERSQLKALFNMHADDGIVSAQIIKKAFVGLGDEAAFKALGLDEDSYCVNDFVDWLFKAPVKKLMIYSSRTPDKADFVDCLKCPGLEYDWETASEETLVQMIAKANDAMTNGEGFDTIALACHGPPAPSSEEGWTWAITKSVVVTSAGPDLGSVGNVLTALATATKGGGRVDLLSCSLLKSEFGQYILKKIESRTGTNFAASSNVVGNPKDGGDWVMESDNINIGPIYFKNLDAFDGTFASASRSKSAATKNIQKVLTADMLKRLDRGQPLVEMARKMKAIEGMQPQINDMERRLGIMQSCEPKLDNAIKTLEKVLAVRGMGRYYYDKPRSY